MAESSGVATGVTVEHHMLADVVTHQLEAMLAVGNYDAVKLLLEPVQPVDIAEAIGNLPTTLQAIAFRLLSKDEAISVYEYLGTTTQQNLSRVITKGFATAVGGGHGHVADADGHVLSRLFCERLTP